MQSFHALAVCLPLYVFSLLSLYFHVPFILTPFPHSFLYIYNIITLSQSAGLSSSASLVCASALTLDQILQTNLPSVLDSRILLSSCNISSESIHSQNVLGEVCAEAERYIGMESGGMDQAICMMASEGEAKRIEFNPLRAFSVRLPVGYQFVIANSLVEATKHATASSCYNARSPS